LCETSVLTLPWEVFTKPAVSNLRFEVTETVPVMVPSDAVETFSFTAGLGGDSVFGYGTGDMADFLVEVEQQGSSGCEVAVGVEDLQRDLMLIAVAEHASEGSEIDAIGSKIQRLHAGNRSPQEWVDAAGIDPRVHRSDACRLSVNRD